MTQEKNIGSGKLDSDCGQINGSEWDRHSQFAFFGQTSWGEINES